MFDLTDLEEANVELPNEEPGEQWLAETLTQLDRTYHRPHLASMARHMALWHTLKGEDDLARVASGAAGKVEQTLTDSALAWVMLRRTMSPALPDDLRPRYELGDPTFRQHLKFTFFEDIQHPKARDLAELDLIELMSDYLEQSLVFVRSEHYPAYEEQATLAASVGREMVEQIYSDAPWELGDFRKKDRKSVV